MNKTEYVWLTKIVDRAVALNPGWGADKLVLMMDIEYTHDFCPLDLEGLANANNFDFMHDISGILQYFNRTSKQLDDCFIPRYALPSVAHVGIDR